MDVTQFREKYNYSSSTKVIQQYLDIKFDNLECLVLFRMGDFYEMFYEDAVLAAKILGLVLTRRGKSGEDEIPMCGLPFHALENYLNKLLKEGLKVAICEQIETPEEAKKRGGYKAIVKREVNRIITLGTLTEESLLEGHKPNYLTSLVIGKNKSAICSLDLSTAKFFVIEIPSDQIINEIVRIKPSEILLSDKFKSETISSNIEMALGIRISFQIDSFFAERKCQKVIEDYYNILSAKSIGEFNGIQISAIGSIVEYISLTQKNSTPKLPFPKKLNSQEFMIIDSATRRNLEVISSLNGNIKDTLFSTINYTFTKGGSRLLYEYLSFPLIKLETINSRINITKFFFENIQLTHVLRKILVKTSDLERSLTRIQMQRGSPRDLLSIRDTILIAKQIGDIVIRNKGKLPTEIKNLVSPLLDKLLIANLISDSIKDDAPNIISDGEIIKTTFHYKIKELRDLIDNSQIHIDKLKDKYKCETGIENLKISTNNIIGIFIDITTKNSSRIKDKKFIHKQTTANSIRYTTNELQELETKIFSAKSTLIELEKEIYVSICKAVIADIIKLTLLAKSINKLDVFLNFAYIADEFEYCLPVLTNEKIFKVKEGRHPVIEKFLKSSNITFSPNECNLDSDEKIWLITGPNMSGKSTFLRQNAIIAILSHIGSFVPALSATIGIVDKIFSRVGAGDDLSRGQSTFMLEMIETSAIMSQSTDSSLIILDEVGRGTSTYDGVAIASSVLEYIHNNIKARCLFATHYHELTSFSNFLPRVANYTISINETEKKILFLHKIVKGFSNRSYGIHVAQIAGLPFSVIQRANEVLFKLENEANNSRLDFIKKKTVEEVVNHREEEKCKKIYKFCQEINPDELSPKEALNILYELKSLLS